jgi:murein DD-endopeptidase MepM/ murein hydrolase activator NlpD
MSTLVAHLVLTVATGVWPLQPQPDVVLGFDPPSVEWGAGHRGVDLLGTVGRPVHAAVAGTVSFAGRIAGRGVVVVDHGSSRTTYEPVAASVEVGDDVVAGQVVGTLEWLGSHCLPRACLHWGLIEGADHYLDPLSLIGCVPRPVRLLPLDRPAPPSESCGATAVTSGQAFAQALLRLLDALVGRPAEAGRR